MSTVIPVVLGLALIVLTLRDVFYSLFHPSARGGISSRVVRGVWRLLRAVSRRTPDRLSLAGPLALLTVIAAWAAAITVGWALLLWPFLPEGFLLSAGMSPEDNAGFRDALYLSMVTLATLGYGDITPQETWLRIVAPLEATLGFAIITAAISWILSVNPILTRRRQLAREVSLLHDGERWSALLDAADGEHALTTTLLRLTEQVVLARTDYEHAPITYYFRQSDPNAAMDIALPRLAAIAAAATKHPSGGVRAQAALLRAAVQDLVQHIGAEYLDREGAADGAILDAYAADQLREG